MLRWTVWYIRSIFCKHDWERKEETIKILDSGFWNHYQMRVSATCKKCGWHRAYWKY